MPKRFFGRGVPSGHPIPLTVPEVRRLLGRLLFPFPRGAMAVLARELVAPMEARGGHAPLTQNIA